MAITFIDGFDLYLDSSHYSRRGWVQGSASLGSLQTGRFGGRAGRLTNGNNVKMTRPITSDDTISIGMAIRFDNVGSFSANGSEFLWFRNGTTDILRVGVTSSGHLRIGRGDFTTNLIASSASGLITTSAWKYLEIELTRNASTGAVNMYLDGTLVATASSANTGASSIDNIGMSGGFCNFDFDDMYITNAATKLGECRVETLRPTADTADADFTPSTGTDNFAMVDDSQVDDDSTYNSSGVSGDFDLFDLENLADGAGSVLAVQPIITARKDDASALSTRTMLKSGSTTSNGATTALGSSYTMVSDIYETNPDTAGAWNATSVNAAQMGYEVI